MSRQNNYRGNRNNNNNNNNNNNVNIEPVYYYNPNHDNGCFSNHSPHKIIINDKEYATAEHYFQSKKFEGQEIEETIRTAKTAVEAKHIASQSNPVSDIPVEEKILFETLKLKFTQHKDLKELLLATGEADLIFKSKDEVWGSGKTGEGQNLHGKQLKRVREKLQMPEYLIVLDFEATCCDDQSIPQNDFEIIEFPSLLVNTETQEIIDQFHEYVKPVLRPKLHPFCIGLTGIQQSWVNKSDPFPDVFSRYQDWMKTHLENKTFCFVTCGDWDLKTMLPKQLRNSNIKINNNNFSQWINIKTAFTKFYGKRVGGMVDMLSTLKIPLVGRHHSGIDDVKNITSVLLKMLADGYSPRPTFIR